MQKSLDRTPELLASLKEANVVDSGGQGLVYIVEGMKLALEDEIIDINEKVEENKLTLDFSKFDENCKPIDTKISMNPQPKKLEENDTRGHCNQVT